MWRPLLVWICTKVMGLIFYDLNWRIWREDARVRATPFLTKIQLFLNVKLKPKSVILNIYMSAPPRTFFRSWIWHCFAFGRDSACHLYLNERPKGVGGGGGGGDRRTYPDGNVVTASGHSLCFPHCLTTEVTTSPRAFSKQSHALCLHYDSARTYRPYWFLADRQVDPTQCTWRGDL